MKKSLLSTIKFCLYLLCFSNISFAAISNSQQDVNKPKMLRPLHVKPAHSEIIVDLNDCKTSKPELYSTTIISNSNAAPKCPDNYAFNKLIFENERIIVDVRSYVKVKCCKQKTSWKVAKREDTSSTPPPGHDLSNLLKKRHIEG